MRDDPCPSSPTTFTPVYPIPVGTEADRALPCCAVLNWNWLKIQLRTAPQGIL